MHAFIYLTLSGLTALAAAAANNANSFNIPKDGYSFKAGEPTTLSWDPTTEGTITLKLQWGAVLTPDSGKEIAANIPNSGKYTWDVPEDLEKQPDYAIEIISDDDADKVNYLPRFVVAGATGEPSKPTPSSTASHSTTEESTSTSTDSSSETPTTMTTTTSTSSSTKSESTTSTTDSSSSVPSTPASTSAKPSGSADPSSSVPNTNAGMINRVSGGMLALVLGAIAVL
ncbi:GPI anchored serine-threonine rich family protein [Aspergillus candidus]|uniref:Ser-Thr-rich glycosyl-phosphatidyl-inositol-anchored membrane family-domain-containing protein n=1 Tax=Aspergillus candidus TaxID=41067 RepID=A0A2I2F0B8_ASPCN|nr:Ser-Thr-rich glycosyl-phosphatidyl-inositol-anchored membrane family-domain-containing protein [Aspergillus candidus]PLB34071.1 Ser-Thr-rich glycosyl-phosphatidyl-inositol-anchored membrane family-domain-containing protein [Aspergillus candidus]